MLLPQPLDDGGSGIHAVPQNPRDLRFPNKGIDDVSRKTGREGPEGYLRLDADHFPMPRYGILSSGELSRLSESISPLSQGLPRFFIKMGLLQLTLPGQPRFRPRDPGQSQSPQMGYPEILSLLFCDGSDMSQRIRRGIPVIRRIRQGADPHTVQYDPDDPHFTPPHPYDFRLYGSAI